jgi:KDO2-lipid IV(A) lauroyltransferase
MISDFAFVLLYYVFRYRKAIVWDNINHAFPEKTIAEKQKIVRDFYKSFCDQWIETVKLLSMSKRSLNKRFTGTWDVFEKLNAEGKNAYIVLGHFYNWEWGNVASQYNAPQIFAGFYQPVSNKAFDRLMLRIRNHGGHFISMKALKEGMKQLQGRTHVIAMIADQNPGAPDVAMWLPFMHREAPFFRGPEQMARRAGGVVVFAAVSKLKRGYYHLHMEVFVDNAATTEQGEITKAYVKFLEAQLHAQPSNWLWSHRRWKHKRKIIS